MDPPEAAPSQWTERTMAGRPTGPPTSSARVVRGGAWRSFPPAVRCAARTGTPESYQLSHVGLRVVQEIE